VGSRPSYDGFVQRESDPERSAVSRRWFLGALGSAACAGALKGQSAIGDLPLSYFHGEPLRIGSQIQLLADDYMVEDRWKLTRTCGKVFKYLRNPIIVRDKPFEGEIGGSPSVVYDPQIHKYRMWYQCFDLNNYFTHAGPNYYIGYAESDDGFNWYKPLLEGFPFGGSPKSNIVTTGRGGKRASAVQVMLNPDQSNPRKRFMMVYCGTQVESAYSADGLHWDLVERPLLPYKSDTINHLVWVSEQKTWFLYERPAVRSNGRGPVPEGLRHTGRRSSVSMSTNLVDWSMPRTVFYPDELGEPDYDGVFVFRRYGMFLAFYSQMFQEHGNSETQIYLATSRDGIRWQRTWDRQPLIPRGPEQSYDSGQVGPGTSAPIDMGSDMLIYYAASVSAQNEWAGESGVAVCRLRRDRFVGQVAGTETGYLLTRQFLLEGNTLKLNCSSPPRSYHRDTDGIQVAILEAPDFQTPQTTFEKAVPGFSLDDCDMIVTDDTSHVVTWRGKSDLSGLRGKAVFLRFRMKNGALYSLQVT